MRQQSFWNKRIPTLLALLLIVIGIGTTAFITRTGTIFRSGASPSESPKNIRVTNINDTSFTVTYTTDTPTLGSISFGKDLSLGTVLLDDRDQTTNTPHVYTVHTVTVKNLFPNTQYFFSIISGDTKYMNNATPFTATTGPTITGASPLQQVVSGAVTLPAGNNGSGALVYLQIPNGQIVSTVTDIQGNYHISLATIRTPDLLQYASVTKTDTISLIFTDGTAISHVATTLQNFPMPGIILSQDYDFTIGSTPTGIPIANEPIGFPLFSTLPNIESPAIIIPQPNQNFTDSQPQFKGLAQPNATVTIIIHSDAAIQTQIIADGNGQWVFRPETALSSGSHTITISTPDASGSIKTITQNFTIFPSGSQVFETATPSATTIPTISPTSGVTLTPTTTTAVSPTIETSITLTVTPTIGATATPEPTIGATATPPPSPTSFIPSPTKAPLPSTGNGSIFTIGLASIIMTIIGIGIFLLTRGESKI
ncbi:MAG TPA: Ig-like domain-containing protein [Candidatus Saccharimonadales bacterium]|nr:Ig-like domain-containing protein [Candidatus Saccharimonadales bacterium]